MSVEAAQTALLFPTGGYHWPGMGSDILETPRRSVVERAEEALTAFGVTPGSLQRLMAGHGQAKRVRTEQGWSWTGDFPLSMVAQMALGVALAEAYIERHGPPALIAGESMGELAAYCVCGVLSLEETARLTYRWATDLEEASRRLGLKMAVIEDLPESEVEALPPPLGANVVVAESPRLLVVALPPDRLDELDRQVVARGGHTLVSNNPCAAHEPRLAAEAAVWAEHERFLATLEFHPARIPLPSTLSPGAMLDDSEALRRNRTDTSFRRVRWDETMRLLPARGIHRVVQFGPFSAGYALKKLRGEVPSWQGMRIATVATVAALAPPPNPDP